MASESVKAIELLFNVVLNRGGSATALEDLKGLRDALISVERAANPTGEQVRKLAAAFMLVRHNPEIGKMAADLDGVKRSLGGTYKDFIEMVDAMHKEGQATTAASEKTVNLTTDIKQLGDSMTGTAKDANSMFGSFSKLNEELNQFVNNAKSSSQAAGNFGNAQFGKGKGGFAPPPGFEGGGRYGDWPGGPGEARTPPPPGFMGDPNTPLSPRGGRRPVPFQYQEYQLASIQRLGAGLITGVPGLQGGIADNALRMYAALNEAQAVMKVLSFEAGGMENALKQVVTQAGPVVVAIAAFAAGIALIDRQIQPVTERLRAALDAFVDVNSQIAQLTLDEQEKKLESAQNTYAAQKKLSDDLEKIYQQNRFGNQATNAFQQAANNLIGGLGSAAPGETGRALGEMEKKITDARIAAERATAEMILYNNAINWNAVLTNQASKALFDEADQRIKLASETNKAIRTGTVKGTQEYVRDLQDKRAAIEKELRNIPELLFGSQDAASLKRRTELQKQLEDIKKLIDTYNNEVLPLVKQREAGENMLKALEDAAKAGDEVAKMESDRALQVSRQQRDAGIQAERDRIESEYADKIEKAKENERLDDYNAKKKEIEDDYMDKSGKALKKYLADELKDNSDFAKKRARLLEDGLDKLLELQAKRDVAGFIREQRDLDKKLKRMDEDANDEQKQRQKNFDDANKAAQDDRDKKLAALKADFEKEERESERLARELAALRLKWQKEDAARRLADELDDYNRRLALQRQKQAEALALAADYWTQANVGIVNAINTVKGVISGLLNAPTIQTGGYGSALSAMQNAINQTPVPAPSSVFNPLSSVSAALSSSYTPPITVPQRQISNKLSRLAGGMNSVPRDFYPAYLDYGERVLTRRENQAYTSGRSGQNINIYNTVGDVLSKRHLDDAIDDIAAAVRIVTGGGNG